MLSLGMKFGFPWPSSARLGIRKQLPRGRVCLPGKLPQIYVLCFDKHPFYVRDNSLALIIIQNTPGVGGAGLHPGIIKMPARIIPSMGYTEIPTYARGWGVWPIRLSTKQPVLRTIILFAVRALPSERN
jgi:hypothetical protein